MQETSAGSVKIAFSTAKVLSASRKNELVAKETELKRPQEFNYKLHTEEKTSMNKIASSTRHHQAHPKTSAKHELNCDDRLSKPKWTGLALTAILASLERTVTL